MNVQLSDNIKALKSKDKSLCVVGLGYVGLPLVIEFARHLRVQGFDISSDKIESLKQATDPNGEMASDDLRSDNIEFTSVPEDIADSTVYLVGVPTPITKHNTPDLNPLKRASETLGQFLKKGDLVVYESTVYPGCTEEISMPILESRSGLKAGIDFYVGYSPERINPGDKVHTLTNTVKIVSGQSPEVLEMVAELYEMIISAGVYRANSIKVAEAAKIIENVQRDLNIALMNELSLIFDRLDIDTRSVIDAAASKWNFMKFYPGLVGGHCISVDPYYLTYKAQEVGYYPQVILSGRNVNDNLSKNVAKKVVQILGSQDTKLSAARILVMGITFKENVSDIRNSKVVDLINELKDYNIDIDIMDPNASSVELKKKTGLELVEQATGLYNCVVVAVQHREYLSLTEENFLSMSVSGGAVIDIKGIFNGVIENLHYWTL